MSHLRPSSWEISAPSGPSAIQEEEEDEQEEALSWAKKSPDFVPHRHTDTFTAHVHTHVTHGVCTCMARTHVRDHRAKATHPATKLEGCPAVAADGDLSGLSLLGVIPADRDAVRSITKRLYSAHTLATLISEDVTAWWHCSQIRHM